MEAKEKKKRKKNGKYSMGFFHVFRPTHIQTCVLRTKRRPSQTKPCRAAGAAVAAAILVTAIEKCNANKIEKSHKA